MIHDTKQQQNKTITIEKTHQNEIAAETEKQFSKLKPKGKTVKMQIIQCNNHFQSFSFLYIVFSFLMSWLLTKPSTPARTTVRKLLTKSGSLFFLFLSRNCQPTLKVIQDHYSLPYPSQGMQLNHWACRGRLTLFMVTF